jgi:superfamily II DNA helicase RecQ
MEADTKKRYAEVMQQILRYAFRTIDWDEDDRPPYEMTGKQLDELDRVEKLLQTPGRESDLDLAVLGWAVALFDHDTKNGPYENVVISGLAVLGLRDDGGWADAIDYTYNYSAIIKIARMLVIKQAVVEYRDYTAKLRADGLDEDDIREKYKGLFDFVRVRVQSILTITPGRGRPRPMDWIFHSRSYGLKIRYTTIGNALISWAGEQVSFRTVRFSISQLSDMLAAMTAEAQALLWELLLVKGPSGLPALDMKSLLDDWGESRIGRSFLDNNESGLAVDGTKWLIHRIYTETEYRERWFAEGPGLEFRTATARSYAETLRRFQEKLLLLVHMEGGLPGRIPELLSLRFQNTAMGGYRNVLIENGQVCLATVYHKNIRSSEQVKLIYRYLPAATGELMVRYLWLVVPFWQRLQLFVWGVEPDAFLWPSETHQPDETAGSTDVTWRPKPWTTDAVSRALNNHSMRLMGSPLKVSAWRHIAEAIANKYISPYLADNPYPGEEGNDSSGDEEFGVSDTILHLQSGHTGTTSELVYGRLQQFGNFGLASKRQAFRTASGLWHRLLGLGGTRKRKLAYGEEDRLDTEQRSAKVRRLNRFRHSDWGARLRQMLGDDSARFRGTQEAVIRAIADGESPIVQVTGTGGGKSLSFMLPAYCSPDGFTVVMVPLVALQDDLQQRCKAAGINSIVWSSRDPTRTASIILVTPESLVSKGFREALERLSSRQVLDRIVIDECHIVLDSTKEFRPKMQQIGDTIADIGAQIVLLTATLPPRDEDRFFRLLHMQRSRARMIRSRTTRKNIRYRVVTPVGEGQDGQDAAVVETVEAGLARYTEGKIIVYSDRIARAEQLAELLDCPLYYSAVDTNEGKRRRMGEWASGRRRVIVATNALGLGIDMPDVRVVVHAGAPRQIRDYAQESGRAGRDGQASEAIVVYAQQGRSSRTPSRPGPQAKASPTEMDRFLGGEECRRVVLDEVMDGSADRETCTDEEAACDVCEGNAKPEDIQAVGPEERSRDVVRSMEADGIQQRERLRLRREQEWAESAGLRELIELVAANCLCCWLAGHDTEHGHYDCPYREGELWSDVEEKTQDLRRSVTKARWAQYSGCFSCGLPQAWCHQWAVTGDDDGKFTRVVGKECQFGTTLFRALAFTVCDAMEQRTDGAVTQTIVEMFAQRHDEALFRTKVWEWLVSREVWAGLETNQLCRVVYQVYNIHKNLLDIR